MSSMSAASSSLPPLKKAPDNIQVPGHSSIAVKPIVERIVFACACVCVFNFSFSEALKEIFLTAGFVFALALIALTGWRPFSRDVGRWAWPFVLFVAGSIASGIHSINTFEGLRGAWGDFESLMGLVLFSATLAIPVRKETVLRGLFASLMGGLFFGGAFGLWKMAHFHLPNLGIMNLGDKNSTAQFLSYATILVFFFHENRRRLSLPFALFPISYGMIALFLYYCHSRAFLLTIPFFLLVMILVLRWWKTLIVWASLLVAFIAVSLINPFFRWEITSVLKPTSDASFESRYPTWEGAIRMWREHPILGVGPDNFHMPNIHKIYNLPEYASHGHNIFFNLLGEYGSLGVVSFALWLSLFGIVTLKSVRRKELSPVALALYIGLMADLLLSGIVHPMWGGTGSLAIMLILAIASNARAGAGSPECPKGDVENDGPPADHLQTPIVRDPR
jgi:putative inorganic carbon (HCO3(-)) transporter